MTWCGVGQNGVEQSEIARHAWFGNGETWHNMAMVWQRMVSYCIVGYGMTLCGMVCCGMDGMMWCSIVRYRGIGRSGMA